MRDETKRKRLGSNIGYGVTVQPATLLLTNLAATSALGLPISCSLKHVYVHVYITAIFTLCMLQK